MAVESEAQKREYQRRSRLAIQLVGAADSGQFDHITTPVVMRELGQAYEPSQFHVGRSGLALLANYVLHLIDVGHATIPSVNGRSHG